MCGMDVGRNQYGIVLDTKAGQSAEIKYVPSEHVEPHWNFGVGNTYNNKKKDITSTSLTLPFPTKKDMESMNGNRSVDLTVQTLHNTNDFITRIQVRDVEQVMYNCDANTTNEKTDTEKSGSKIISNYLMNIMSIRTKSENVHKKSIQLEEKKRKSRQKQNQQRYEREENERKRKKLENEEIKKKKMQQERALNHYLFRMMSGTADQLDDSIYKVPTTTTIPPTAIKTTTTTTAAH